MDIKSIAGAVAQIAVKVILFVYLIMYISKAASAATKLVDVSP